MRIVFIGAGNLATNLALELKRHSHTIIQIYSRTIDSAQLLADKIGCEATNNIERIDTDAELYVFSVKDSALASLLKQIPTNNGIWVHTAGSLPMNIFEGFCQNYGVIYPFQTFNKDRKVDFKNIPFFIEAKSADCLNTLSLALKPVSNKVTELSSEKRKYIHLTGVFACNFVNHMYRISQDILNSQDIPFDVLLPLIDETASKIHSITPADAQTGPAIRFDENVMNEHLSLLTDTERKNIYNLLSRDIHKSATGD